MAVPIADKDGHLVCYGLQCWCGDVLFFHVPRPFDHRLSTSLEQVSLAQEALAHVKALLEEATV